MEILIQVSKGSTFLIVLLLKITHRKVNILSSICWINPTNHNIGQIQKNNHNKKSHTYWDQVEGNQSNQCK